MHSTWPLAYLRPSFRPFFTDSFVVFHGFCPFQKDHAKNRQFIRNINSLGILFCFRLAQFVSFFLGSAPPTLTDLLFIISRPIDLSPQFPATSSLNELRSRAGVITGRLWVTPRSGTSFEKGLNAQVKVVETYIYLGKQPLHKSNLIFCSM